MGILVGILYVAAIVCLTVAAVRSRSLVLTAAACALTAYALPAIITAMEGL